ncbi:MAG: tripartite tricarboxylate transporter substrate-binding protein [Burkholderiales bacterium]
MRRRRSVRVRGSTRPGRGHLSIMFERMCSALHAITGGKLRALAVIRARRLPILPEVRTLAEAGIRAD